MNILYISTQDPRLRNGGTGQRTNLLWESLKRHGRVYTFISNFNFDTDSIIENGDHPIYLARLEKKNRIFWRIINRVLSKASLFNVFRRKIIKINNPNNVFEGVHFDVVVTRYVYPLTDYAYWDIAPLLIDIDDHPLQIYQTVFEKQLHYGLRAVGKCLTMLQTKYIINRSVGGWIANKEQLNLCGKNYVFLSNIPLMPSEDYKADFNERKNLFTVGVMGYRPNKEGVTRFLTQVWPSFHQKYPDVMYFIVGIGASDADADMWNSCEGVKYLGFVENLETLYERTLATVVPVYSGGGTCIKTLEAMAYSRPCICTKFGARGLPQDVIEEKKGILVFEDSESFIEAYKLLQNESCRQKIEIQGSNVIKHNYSIDSFNKAVDEVLFKSHFMNQR